MSLMHWLKRLDGRIARWCGWEVPLDENGHIRRRKGTRDVVETGIDQSKSDRRKTWEELVRETGELPVTVMASSRAPAADPGRSGK